MVLTRRIVRRLRGISAVLGVALVLAVMVGWGNAGGQEAPSMSEPPRGRPVQSAPAEPEVQSPVRAASRSHYDPAVFLKLIPADQMAGLAGFDGAQTSELMRDKGFRKVLKSFVPDCTFHYGYDMSMEEALDRVLKESRVPVRVTAGRYLVAGGSAPMLGGRGFLWIDLKEGLGMGGFWFHPTNGEPTPSLVVFSREVKQDGLAMSELPPAFQEALGEWSEAARISPVTTTYFINGGNKRVLLEHDEDYCSLSNGTVAPAGDACEQMNADAADVDETAAYYLDQVHYRTNATAWMIGPDQVAWLSVRERTCGGVADPLGCRIRVTREHTHVILRGGGVGRPRP